MDVPMNHWAYDAIGQLASKGVLSGYPDGAYKGKQPTTRYEMASALARALALVDMTKANKQDVEMLKRLVVEFKDELDALGVKVEGVDKRLAVVEQRLGGWKISGELRLDVEDWDNDNVDGDAFNGLSRLEFQRWFGEDEDMYFYVSLEDGGDSDRQVVFDNFFIEFPFFWDSRLTVGRMAFDFESDYRFETGGATDIANGAWLGDRTMDGMLWQKSFRLGAVNFYVARPTELPTTNADEILDAWEAAFVAQLQFTERFGVDFGAQAIFGDDASVFSAPYANNPDAEFRVDNIWTLFGGLRFDFNENIALKGIYYYQDHSAEVDYQGVYEDFSWDSASAWKAIVDIKQDMLKFTSLWLEYSYLEEGFYLPYSNVALTLVDTDQWNTADGGSGVVGHDTSIWRLGALQEWNEKWSSWLYVAGHTLDNAGLSSSGSANDAKALQWGVGLEYRYNENVTFALNYIKIDWNDAANRATYEDEHRIQFRTAVAF